MATSTSFPDASHASRVSDTSSDQNVSRIPDTSSDKKVSRIPDTSSDQNLSRIPDTSSDKKVSRIPDTSSDQNVSRIPDTSSDKKVSRIPDTSSDKKVSRIPDTSSDQNVSRIPDTSTDQNVSRIPDTLSDEWKTLQRLFPQSSLSAENSKFEDYTIVVPVSVDAKDFVVSFSLTSNYPFEVPYICLSSSMLSKSEINNMVESMDLMSAGSIGHPMLVSCIEEGMDLLQRRDEHKKLKGKRNRNHKKQRKNKADQLLNATDKGNDSICSSSDDNSHSKDIVTSNLDDLVTSHFENIKIDDNSATDSKSLRPNYFIAIRINNENLIENLVAIQNALVEKEALLTKGVIPLTALHITLCNLGLDSADDLVRAIEVLRKMKAELQHMLPISPLIIHGASQFYDRAIYANVKASEEFLAFRDMLIRQLNVAGVAFREDHEQYTPHVTLIKVRRPERRMFGNRPINPAIYSSFLKHFHGEQNIDAIFLCAMDGNKREDGFYITPYELQFETGH